MSVSMVNRQEQTHREPTLRERLIRRFRKDRSLHLMLLLPVLFILVYRYIPMVGNLMAFEKYQPAKGIFGSEWVGLNNFKTLFRMKGFVNAIGNTLIIALGKIVLNIVVPVTFSLMLNEFVNNKVKKTIQTVIYMPHFISWVLLAGIIVRLTSQTGLINQAIVALGGKPQIFLADKASFRPLLLITDIWKEFGYGTVIYLAAIAGVNQPLYEAARVDGANHWQEVWHITIPGILPTIILMSALALGRILDGGFEQVLNLYNPVVYETGDIIDTFIYRLAFNNAQYSMSAAAGLFKSAISCILIVSSYRIAYSTSGYRIF